MYRVSILLIHEKFVRQVTRASKRFGTAKSLAAREVILQCSKVVSSAGSHFAVQQNRLRCGKSLCSAAKSFAVREVTLQCSKIISCAGNRFAVQQYKIYAKTEAQSLPGTGVYSVRKMYRKAGRPYWNERRAD